MESINEVRPNEIKYKNNEEKYIGKNFITNKHSDKLESRVSIFDNVIKIKKTTANENNVIENDKILTIIDLVQKEMITYNLYTKNYKLYAEDKNDINDTINILKFSTTFLLFIFLLICLLLGVENINDTVGVGIIILIMIIVVIPNNMISKMEFFKNILSEITVRKKVPQKHTINYKKYIDKSITLELYHLSTVKTNIAIIKDEIYYDSGKIFYSGTLCGNKFGTGKFYYEDGTSMYEKLA